MSRLPVIRLHFLQLSNLIFVRPYSGVRQYPAHQPGTTNSLNQNLRFLSQLLPWSPLLRSPLKGRCPDHCLACYCHRGLCLCPVCCLSCLGSCLMSVVFLKWMSCQHLFLGLQQSAVLKRQSCYPSVSLLSGCFLSHQPLATWLLAV